MGHSTSKETIPHPYPLNSNQTTAAAAAAAATTSTSTHFPHTFNMYYDRSSLQLRNIHYGEHESQPLYSASLPEGWWGKLTLHNGPYPERFPTVATVKDSGKWRTQSEIILSEHMSEGLPVREELRANRRRVREQYLFSCPVGRYSGDNDHREKFEWRRAKKHELECLGESSRGWKLVRLPENYDESTKKDSVEREVVAVWAEAKILKSGFSKIAKFQFRNTGAAGELGDVWVLMAVVTFTRIWQKTMQAVMTAPG